MPVVPPLTAGIITGGFGDGFGDGLEGPEGGNGCAVLPVIWLIKSEDLSNTLATLAVPFDPPGAWTAALQKAPTQLLLFTGVLFTVGTGSLTTLKSMVAGLRSVSNSIWVPLAIT